MLKRGIESKGGKKKSVTKCSRAAHKIYICAFLYVCIFLNGWIWLRKCLKIPTEPRSLNWFKNYFYRGVKLEWWREPLSPGLTLVEVTSLQHKGPNSTGLRAPWIPSCRRLSISCLGIPTLGLGEAAPCEVSPRTEGPTQPIPLTSPGVKGGALTSSILSPAVWAAFVWDLHCSSPGEE